MLELYFFAAYSFRRNEWSRYLVAGQNQEAAKQELDTYLEDAEEKIRGPGRFVCKTADRVFLEV
jgi:hypothetical protein